MNRPHPLATLLPPRWLRAALLTGCVASLAAGCGSGSGDGDGDGEQTKVTIRSIPDDEPLHEVTFEDYLAHCPALWLDPLPKITREIAYGACVAEHLEMDGVEGVQCDEGQLQRSCSSQADALLESPSPSELFYDRACPEDNADARAWFSQQWPKSAQECDATWAEHTTCLAQLSEEIARYVRHISQLKSCSDKERFTWQLPASCLQLQTQCPNHKFVAGESG